MAHGRARRDSATDSASARVRLDPGVDPDVMVLQRRRATALADRACSSARWSQSERAQRPAGVGWRHLLSRGRVSAHPRIVGQRRTDLDAFVTRVKLASTTQRPGSSARCSRWSWVVAATSCMTTSDGVASSSLTGVRQRRAPSVEKRARRPATSTLQDQERRGLASHLGRRRSRCSLARHLGRRKTSGVARANWPIEKA